MEERAPETKDFFLNIPLYKKYSKEYVGDVENFDEKLDMYCPGCKQNSIFKRIDDTPNKIAARAIGFPGGGFYGSRSEEGTRVFLTNFECTRDEDHKAIFIFRADETFISKIGEYPSKIDREYLELRKYEKYLG